MPKSNIAAQSPQVYIATAQFIIAFGRENLEASEILFIDQILSDLCDGNEEKLAVLSRRLSKPYLSNCFLKPRDCDTTA